MSGSAEEMVSARIEMYLRNEMDGEDRAAFEREMLRDPALRAEVELERTISERLRAMYAPPAPPALPTPLAMPVAPVATAASGVAGSTRGPATRPWVRIALGIAAVLAIAAGVHFSGVLGPAPGGTKADAILARLERTGFEPAWACEDDAEFVQYTREKFGQAFTVAPASGVQVIGWDYCSGVLGDEAGVMMVNLGEEERAIVIVDRKSHDRPVEIDASGGLRVHRLRVGGAVLYEVSKRESPAVLPLVSRVD